MPKDSFFQILKEWSARKHRLISKYLVGFTRILGGTMGMVYYIDGFAGPGIYEEDGTEGSPVLAVKYAMSLRAEGKGYQLRCINVEEKHEWFANLVQATADYAAVVVRNLEGQFQAHLDEILDLIGDSPALFFLDPWGVKGIEWDSMVRILTRPYTDVWLRLDELTIARLLGFLHSKGRGADAKCGTLCAFYGLTRPELTNRLSGDSVDEAVQLYLERLAQAHKGYAAAYPIRTIKGQRKYYLAFACGDEKGLVLASNIVYGEEETFQREIEEYQAKQQEGKLVQRSFFPALDPTPEDIFADKVCRLKSDIWKHCSGQRVRGLDLRAEVLLRGEWFGRIAGKHFTQALRELEEEGYISDREGARSKDSSFLTFRSA